MSSSTTPSWTKCEISCRLGSVAASSKRPYGRDLRDSSRSRQPRLRRAHGVPRGVGIRRKRSKRGGTRGKTGSGGADWIRPMADFLLDSDVVIWHLRGNAAVVEFVLALARRGR